MGIIQETKTEKITALYCRVSTDAQLDGYSIDAQTEILESYCKAKQIYNYKVFVDGGYSGSNLNRPSIQEIINLSKEQKLNSVIVYKLDRISRSQKDTMFLIEDIFLPNGVDFISINESFDTSSPFGKAMIGTLSVFSQLERDTIKMRTRMGMKKRVEEGYWMGGGVVPFGYDYDKNLGTLVQNEDAEKVKKMYELYLEGYSCDSIAKMFDLKYDRLVYQILTRKSNTGIIVYNGEEYDGRHKAIITMETYEQTMKEMKRRSEKKLSAKSEYLLAGLLFCGKCGAKMRYQKWGKSGNCKIYCYSQQNSKPYLIKDPNCDNKKNDSTSIEQAVINDIFKHFSPQKNEDIIVDESASLINILTEKCDSLKNKIKNLYILFSDNPDETLRKLISDKQLELQETETLIKKEKEKKQVIAKNQKQIEEFIDLKDKWDLLTIKEKKKIIHSCVEKITIFDNKVIISYSF